MKKERKKQIWEIKEIIKDLEESKVFSRQENINADKERLQAYASYLSAKSNEEMLKAFKWHNGIIYGLTIINLVFIFIHLWLIVSN